jgi:hypothetical protein
LATRSADRLLEAAGVAAAGVSPRRQRRFAEPGLEAEEAQDAQWSSAMR